MHDDYYCFIADTVTPISAYLALASEREACLLESVDTSGGQISRYSFIGLDYAATRTFTSHPNLVDDIREFVTPFRKAFTALKNFPGAALLMYSYDAARSFARLKPREAAEPPIADAYVAVPHTWLIFDHHSDTAALHVAAHDAAVVQERLHSYRMALANLRPGEPGPVRGRGTVHHSMDRSQYLARVAQIKAHITDGQVYQLQLGIRFSAAIEARAFDLYRQLRSRNPSPYMFYLNTPFGELLGASPEFLVRLEERQARIRPLAGTRPRGATSREDREIAQELLDDPKERAEHVMLVDLGRNDLSMVCEPGSVRVNQLLAIERYSHVMHIVSDCVGTLREDRDALDLLAAGFPAGTVTGAPKIRAMQLIDGLEPSARGFYAGSIGRLGFNGDFDSCITLRSVHVKHGRAYWQASAGIVADSDPQSEYNEVFAKTRIIREALGI